MLFFKKDRVDSNAILAHNIFNTLSVGRSLSQKEQDEVNKAISGCSDRQEILNKIVELCSPANTSHRRYLVAIALAWSRVKYRKDAIIAINNYLDNPLYVEGYESRRYGRISGIIPNSKSMHISEMLCYLGKAYEGEYLLEEAYEAFSRAYAETPYSTGCICDTIRVLTKLGRLESAKQLCLLARQSAYYRPYHGKTIDGKTYIDSSFKKVIDNETADINKKIKEGYTYKPRKSQKK